MLLITIKAHSAQIFRNAYYQDSESSLFNKNTYTSQFLPSVPQLPAAQGLVKMCKLILRS